MWVDPVQVSYARHQTCQLDEIVWGRLSTGAVLAMWNSEWLRESLTTPGRPLAGGCTPNPGVQDGAVAVSFVRCLGVSWSTDRLVSWRVGSGVQPLQGENYTYSRVLGHVHPYFFVTSSSLVLPDFYLPLVYFPARIAVEVREREFSHRPGMRSGRCE